MGAMDLEASVGMAMDTIKDDTSLFCEIIEGITGAMRMT